MAESVMLAHCGARDVMRGELMKMEPPPPTKTWFPLAHSHVLDRVTETLEGAGFSIDSERLTVSASNARFFSTLDLSVPVKDGIGLAVGIRNSTDKSFPIGCCMGSRVFVCDNLSFSSNIVIKKRHTRFGDERFAEAISSAMQGLHEFREAEAHRIDKLSSTRLSEDAANSYMLQAWDQKIINSRMLPEVIRQWRDPEMDSWRPRNAWTLFNCFTWVLKDQQFRNPQKAAHTTIRLHKLFARADAGSCENGNGADE